MNDMDQNTWTDAIQSRLHANKENLVKVKKVKKEWRLRAKEIQYVFIYKLLCYKLYLCSAGVSQHGPRGTLLH